MSTWFQHLSSNLNKFSSNKSEKIAFFKNFPLKHENFPVAVTTLTRQYQLYARP